MAKRTKQAPSLLSFRVIVALLLAVVAGLMLVALLRLPYKGFPGSVTIDFPPGTSTRQMATQLESAGVIRSRWLFLLARALRFRQVLQAGEYRFEREASIQMVLYRLVSGDIVTWELRVPEGSNLFDISELVGQFGWMNKTEFLRTARDPAMIRDLAPRATSLEGFLFPAVYRITRRHSARDVAEMMTRRFRREWETLPRNAASPFRIATLASLVEKETGRDEDRPAIAGVYARRLDLGMKLDCDPTVIYAALLEDRWRGTIYRSDLDNLHPYNTYQHTGLPPGPIANAGRRSLVAALHPAAGEFLYFVASGDGSGRSVFSRTLAEHNNAVAGYRHALAQQSQSTTPPAAR
jgi:UPF0755 protein